MNTYNNIAIPTANIPIIPIAIILVYLLSKIVFL